jgi:hypothetical protein
MLREVDAWPHLRLRESAFGELDAALSSAAEVQGAFDELRAVLGTCRVPPQKNDKSHEWYIYDQSELQKMIRGQLVLQGWTRGRVLAPAENVGRVNVTAAKADLLKDGVHAMLDFGNRAAYAYHFFTQAFLAQVAAQVRLTVLVVPTYRFADCIDSNLTTFERVNVEVRRVARINGATPSPLAVIGVEPDVE